MRGNEKASLSLRRTVAISLIFVFIMGVAVIAGNTELNSVTIQFSNNHEITVLTSRTKVSEILADNNIILASNEEVAPGLDEEITDARVIEIFEKGTREVEIIEVAEGPDENTIQEIIQRYEDIKYKIVVETVEIPFETITRDVSSGNEATDNRVIQAGRNGLRETRYKITFQNDVEISRLELESTVIREPENRIVQIQTRPTTRGGARNIGIGYIQTYAHQHVMSRGWSDNDFDALLNLWHRESNWNPNAVNSSSGATGIPQAMMSVHFRNNPSGAEQFRGCWQTQVRWGINYIAGRYSTPTAAWNHFQRFGWY